MKNDDDSKVCELKREAQRKVRMATLNLNHKLKLAAKLGLDATGSFTTHNFKEDKAIRLICITDVQE